MSDLVRRMRAYDSTAPVELHDGADAIETLSNYLRTCLDKLEHYQRDCGIDPATVPDNAKWQDYLKRL